MRCILATMLLRCGRALRAPVTTAARRGRALGAAPTSFPLTSIPNVAVEYGGAASDFSGDLLLLPFWSDKIIDLDSATIAQGWDAAFGGALTELAETQEFTGKRGERHVLTVPGRLQGVRKVALVGLGPKDKALEGYAALGAAAGACADIWQFANGAGLSGIATLLGAGGGGDRANSELRRRLSG